MSESPFSNLLNSLTVVDDSEIDRREREQAEADRVKRVRESGIPERYFQETFDTYSPRSPEETKNRDDVKKFSESGDGFLIILGGVGVGKTHLACSCLQNNCGRYIDVPTLEIEVECSRDFSAPENKLKVLKRYIGVPLLIIDEVGRASNASAEKSFLYYIINQRYGARKKTVLVSNFSEKEFAEYLGSAIIDRIAENRVFVKFTGESYRRRNRQEPKKCE